MQLRRVSCMALICVLLVSALSFPASATEISIPPTLELFEYGIAPLATNSFSMSIPAKTKAVANMSFPLMAGETVTIKASYAPFSASVDFGLIAPDGKFYYFNITNGSIDKTIKVSESGSYTLQIRNNSDGEVKVSGFVNY
jgi:hypothetical protein